MPAVCVDYRCEAESVYDAKTSLTWQRTLPALYDGCTGRSASSAAILGDACTWDSAKRYCSKLSVAGGSWRLPTKDELMALVRAGSANPAIDTTAFPKTPAEPFWTASPYTASTGYAWTVFFSNTGGTYYYQTSNAYRVRCVR